MTGKEKFKDIPLSGLLTMQQVIEFGAAEITDLFFKAMKDYEDKKVGKPYFDQLENELEKLLEKNNIYISEVETEIRRRMKTVFPKITLGMDLKKFKDYHLKELDYFKKIYEKPTEEPLKENPVIKPLFKASREKRNDNQ